MQQLTRKQCRSVRGLWVQRESLDLDFKAAKWPQAKLEEAASGIRCASGWAWSALRITQRDDDYLVPTERRGPDWPWGQASGPFRGRIMSPGVRKS